MKAVLDTNVLISGIFFGGPPATILRSWRDGLIRLVLSTEILEEYLRVAEFLSSDYPGVEPRPLLNLVIAQSLFIDAPALSERVGEDRADEKFLACALAARCRTIISGDRHLQRVSGYRGISVLAPSKFVDEVLPKLKARDH